MSFLVLVRHGQSEWNAKNLFTGWKDPDLTDLGIEEAKKAGAYITDLGIAFDAMFTSDLVRAQRTGNIILEAIKQTPPITKNIALNESCLLYTSPSPRDATLSRMPSSA